MADSAPIEELTLAVTSSTKEAVDGINALKTSLGNLKTAVKGGLGLKSISTNLTSIADAGSRISDDSVNNLNGLIKALQSLEKLKGVKISSSIGRQLSSIGTSLSGMRGVNFGTLNQLTDSVKDLSAVSPGNMGATFRQMKKIPEIMTAISDGKFDNGFSNLKQLYESVNPLANLPKGGLGTMLNQIKKLPEAMEGLAKISEADMTVFRDRIKQVADAMRPLADEMDKVARGFSAFPSKIQKFLNSTSKVPSVNNRASRSFLRMGLRIGAIGYMAHRAYSAIAHWINESNQYIENLNLFNVSMGEFADEASRYAEKVGEIMGIDPGEWMRNQGVFQTLATGFGVTADRAYIMSKNLTQLGYDLSSFFNLSTAESFQKLQSGLAGELEPLRRLGFDLSKARLEQEALNLGIQKNYNVMTQAEKAQLRYVAILSQVTTAQGDMARTLDAPANQLRILRAQVVMAARSLGNIFIPMLNAILPYAIAAAKVIRILADAIARLFGFKLPKVDYSGIKQMGAGAGNIADNLGNATGNAKELKKALLGIDELNVLPSPPSGGGSGTGGMSGGGGFDFELPEYDFLGDAVSTRVDGIVTKMKDWLGITEEIDSWSDLFHTRLGLILTLVGLVGTTMAGWKIANGVLSFAGLFKDAGTAGATGAGIAGTVATIGLSIAGLLVGGGSFFWGIWDAVHNGLNWLNGMIIPAGSTLAGASIGAIIGSLGGPIGAGLGALAGLAVGTIVDVGIAIKENWGEIKSFWKDQWAQIKSGLSRMLPDFVNGLNYLADSAVSKIKSVADWITEKAEKVADSIKSAWGDLKNWVRETVIDPIKDLFDRLDIHIKTPHFSWEPKPIQGIMAQILGAVGLPAAIPSLSVSWYANGGFPTDGELFVAREAGPEMVGSVGNRTAVANNDQIVEAVSRGVYDALVSAMSSSGGSEHDDRPVQIYLDGRMIAESTTKYQRQMARATGGR